MYGLSVTYNSVFQGTSSFHVAGSAFMGFVKGFE